MANKHDLKSWLFTSTAALASNTTNIGSQVASGKTRFLTHIRVDRTAQILNISDFTEVEMFLATQTTGSSFLSTLGDVKAVAQLAQVIPAASADTSVQAAVKYVKEMRGTIEQPLLTISGGSTLVVGMSSAAMAVFAQYYDE